MSTKANHRKRSHRSHQRAGYAAARRKWNATEGQAGNRGFGLFRGLFHSRARETRGNGGPMRASAPTAETEAAE